MKFHIYIILAFRILVHTSWPTAEAGSSSNPVPCTTYCTYIW
jgi:hypothetical protein